MLFFLKGESEKNFKNGPSTYDQTLKNLVTEDLDSLFERQRNLDNFAIQMEHPSYHIPAKISMKVEIAKFFSRFLLTILGIFCLFLVIYENPKEIINAFRKLIPKPNYLPLLKKNNHDLYRVALAAYHRQSPILDAVVREIVEFSNNKRNGCIPPISQHRNFLIIGASGSGKSNFKALFDYIGLLNEQVPMQHITAPGYVGKNYTGLMESVKKMKLVHFDEIDKLYDNPRLIAAVMADLSKANLGPSVQEEQIKYLSGVFNRLQLKELVKPTHSVHQLKSMITNYDTFFHRQPFNNNQVIQNYTLRDAIQKYGENAYIGLVGSDITGYDIKIITQYDQTEAMRNALIKFYPEYSEEFWWRIPKIFYLENTNLEKMIFSVLDSVNTYMEMQTQTARNFNTFIFYHPEILIEIIKNSNGNYRKIESCMSNLNEKFKGKIGRRSKSAHFALVGFKSDTKKEVISLVKQLCYGNSLSQEQFNILTEDFFTLDVPGDKKLLIKERVERLLFENFDVTLKFGDGKSITMHIFPFSITQSFYNAMEKILGTVKFQESFRKKIIEKIFSKNYDLHGFSRYFSEELISYMNKTYSIDPYTLWEKISPKFIIDSRNFNVIFSDIAKKVMKRKINKKDNIIITIGEGDIKLVSNLHPITIDLSHIHENINEFPSKPETDSLDPEKKFIEEFKKYIKLYIKSDIISDKNQK